MIDYTSSGDVAADQYFDNSFENDGPYVIDGINGISSEQHRISISRYEAKVLVRHWLLRCDQRSAIGVTASRVNRFGMRRIAELVDRGLVKESDVQNIERELYGAASEPAFARGDLGLPFGPGDDLDLPFEPEVTSPRRTLRPGDTLAAIGKDGVTKMVRVIEDARGILTRKSTGLVYYATARVEDGGFISYLNLGDKAIFCRVFETMEELRDHQENPARDWPLISRAEPAVDEAE